MGLIDTIRNILMFPYNTAITTLENVRTSLHIGGALSHVISLLIVTINLSSQPVSIFLYFIEIPINVCESFYSTVAKTLTFGKNTCIWTVVSAVVSVGLLWISILLFGIVYYRYIPTLAHDVDVNLQFSDCAAKRMDGAVACGYPSANLILTGPGLSVLLSGGVTYQAGLTLVMPDSEPNRELGMFMVSVQLYTDQGSVIKQGSRAVSSILPYKSGMFSSVHTLLVFPLYVLNIYQYKHDVHIILINEFVEDPFRPLRGVHIELQRHNIHIYTAELNIKALLSGLSYVLYHYPITAAVVGVCSIWVLLCMFALVVWWNISHTHHVTVTSQSPRTTDEPANTSLDTSENSDVFGDEIVIDEKKKNVHTPPITQRKRKILELNYSPENSDVSEDEIVLHPF